MPMFQTQTTILTSMLCLPLLSSVLHANAATNPDSKTAQLSSPTNHVERTRIRTAKHIELNGKRQALKQTLHMKTGYADNGEIYGALKNANGETLKHPDGSPVICNGTSNNPTAYGAGLDYTSIIEQDGKIHMISQFECVSGAMYTSELKQSLNGELSPVAGTLHYIDPSAYKGGWIHCAGSVTPWNSHIGSEEYEPDARKIEADPTSDKKYVSSAIFFGNREKLNPYFYGWIPEVKIVNGEPQYTKHYSLGRASHELAYVMPDKKTVYLTDDGTNDGFYRFVADKEGDLSAGTLYAAKWTQTAWRDGGAAKLSWINLGHAHNEDIKKLALSGTLRFSQIFDVANPLDENAGTCEKGFTFVNTQTGRECLAVKDINQDNRIDGRDEALAARLETRRMAAYKGATTEFRKFEGFTYNPKNHKAYVALSSLARGMEARFSITKNTDKYDRGGNNDINLPSNPCGAVYELDLDDNFVATQMTSILTGAPLKETDRDGNSCHPDHIANPDNVAMISGTNTLMMGEDSGKHTNNVVWTYDVESKAFARLATVPLKAETTSPYAYKVGKYHYLSLVTQHPMANQNTDQSNKESSISIFGPLIIE